MMWYLGERGASQLSSSSLDHGSKLRGLSPNALECLTNGNSQNCRIGTTEHPLATQLVPLHPTNVTAWCRFTASFIIWPYFFEDTGDFGPVTITVTGQRYECLLRNPVIPDL
ncbi:uncharacterized protein TNCV_166711 [Trichonephila clavipes]|nr:uncharacterized protein TNCV_166711 [Trichonephila clavipes]